MGWANKEKMYLILNEAKGAVLTNAVIDIKPIVFSSPVNNISSLHLQYSKFMLIDKYLFSFSCDLEVLYVCSLCHHNDNDTFILVTRFN